MTTIHLKTISTNFKLNDKILSTVETETVFKLREILRGLKNPPTATVDGQRVSLQYGWKGQGPMLTIFPEYGNEFRVTTYFRRPMNGEIFSLEDVFPMNDLETVIRVLSIIYI